MQGVVIKKLSKKIDNRGSLIKVLMQHELGETNTEFGEIYITTANPGVIKGNHYHPRTTEWFYLISGEGRLVLEDGQGDREEIDLSGETPVVVRVPSGIHHAIKNTGQNDMYLLAYACNPFDPADTIPATLQF